MKHIWYVVFAVVLIGIAIAFAVLYANVKAKPVEQPPAAGPVQIKNPLVEPQGAPSATKHRDPVVAAKSAPKGVLIETSVHIGFKSESDAK